MDGLDEGDTKGTGPSSIKSPPLNKKWLVVLVALTLVGVIGFTSFLLVDWQNDSEDPFEFQSNEYVDYSLTGQYVDGAPINGSYHMLPYNGLSWSSGTGVLPEFNETFGSCIYWLDVQPILSAEYKQIYCFIGNERISTPFGEKAVRTMIGPCGNSTVIINAGLQTSLVYRIYVVNQAYHYTIFMNGTDSLGIWDCDDQYREDHAEVLNVVKADANVYGNCRGCGMITWGLVEVGSNQSLKYRIEGMNGTMFFFSMDDVLEIEEDCVLHHNTTLSMIRANGSIDIPVKNGIYYFFFFMDGSEEFESEDHGWLHLYWGIRED
jgi:hypothetical protein